MLSAERVFWKWVRMFGENRVDMCTFADGKLETPGKGRKQKQSWEELEGKDQAKNVMFLFFVLFFFLPVALQLSAELMRSCSSINSMFG